MRQKGRRLENDFCFHHQEGTVIRVVKRGKYIIRRGVCRSCEVEAQHKCREAKLIARRKATEPDNN